MNSEADDEWSLERFVNQGLRKRMVWLARHENGSFHRPMGPAGTNRTCRVAQRSDWSDGSHMSYWSLQSN